MFFGDRESACSLIKELNFHKMLSKSTWSLIVDLTTKPVYVSLEQNLLLYFVSANVTCHFEAVELQSSQLIYIIVCFFFLYNSTVLLSNFVTSVMIGYSLAMLVSFYLTSTCFKAAVIITQKHYYFYLIFVMFTTSMINLLFKLSKSNALSNTLGQNYFWHSP